MNKRSVEDTFRHFLLIVSGAIALGTIVELWLTEHTEEPIQYLPFVICVLALLSILAVALRPSRPTILTLRGIMGLSAAVSFFGAFEHFTANYGFAQEIQPNAAMPQLIWSALHGASPLLAPGILGLMAILAIAATYAHPANQ